MSRRFRLAAVLRAWQAQEDVAKGRVVRARREAAEASARARGRQGDLAARGVPTEGTARAVVAALSARQSLGAALTAALKVAQEAQEQTGVRVEELTTAAQRRRGVEKLADRHAAEERHRHLRADQHANDELAGSDGARTSAREVGQ